MGHNQQAWRMGAQTKQMIEEKKIYKHLNWVERRKKNAYTANFFNEEVVAAIHVRIYVKIIYLFFFSSFEMWRNVALIC